MHMNGKSKGFLTKIDRGPLRNGWKITKKATCVFEGADVHMKKKSKGF